MDESYDESVESAQKLESKLEGEELVRVNAEVPRSMRKWLQMQSVKEERPMKEIIIEGLKLYRQKYIE